MSLNKTSQTMARIKIKHHTIIFYLLLTLSAIAASAMLEMVRKPLILQMLDHIPFILALGIFAVKRKNLFFSSTFKFALFFMLRHVIIFFIVVFAEIIIEIYLNK